MSVRGRADIADHWSQSHLYWRQRKPAYPRAGSSPGPAARPKRKKQLKLRLIDVYNKPFKNKAYRLEVESQKFQGQTDETGDSAPG